MSADVDVNFAAQFADVKKSLDGLLDYIKGWGESVKAIGIAAFAAWAANKAITGIVSIFHDAKHALEGFIEAAAGTEEIDKRLEVAIKNTGASFAYTAEQLNEYADILSTQSVYSSDAIKQAETIILRFHLVGQEFRDATKAALAMAAVTGKDLPEAANILGRAIANPTQALFYLRRANVTVSEAAQQQIKDLVALGKTQEAQQIIIAAVRREYGAAAAEMMGTWKGLGAQIHNLLDDIKSNLGSGLLQTLEALREPIVILLQRVRELSATFKEWVASVLGSTSVKSWVDTVRDAVFTLFSYIEEFFRRIPNYLSIIFNQIKLGLAELKVGILEIVDSMPKGLVGADNKAKVGAMLGESKRTPEELAAIKSFNDRIAGSRDASVKSDLQAELAAYELAHPSGRNGPAYQARNQAEASSRAAQESLDALGSFASSANERKKHLDSMVADNKEKQRMLELEMRDADKRMKDKNNPFESILGTLAFGVNFLGNTQPFAADPDAINDPDSGGLLGLLPKSFQDKIKTTVTRGTELWRQARGLALDANAKVDLQDRANRIPMPFQSSLEDANSVFRRIQISAAGSGQQDQAKTQSDLQRDMLQSMRDKFRKDEAEAALWKSAREKFMKTKFNGVAVAAP